GRCGRRVGCRRFCGRRSGGHGLRGRRRRRSRGSLRLRRGGSAGAVGDLAEQRADRDRVAVFRRDVGEDAGGRRRHLDRDLVGLELDQRLVDRDRVAGLLEPFADGGLGDGFAERRDANIGHDLCPYPSWPGWSRPSTSVYVAKTGMPGTRPGMTYSGVILMLLRGTASTAPYVLASGRSRSRRR